jgi:hypothetical protein
MPRPKDKIERSKIKGAGGKRSPQRIQIASAELYVKVEADLHSVQASGRIRS